MHKSVTQWRAIMAQNFWLRKHYETHVRTGRTAHADEALPACKGLKLEADHFWFGVEPLIRLTCQLSPPSKS